MPEPISTKPRPNVGSVDDEPVNGKSLPVPLEPTVVTVEPSVSETSIVTECVAAFPLGSVPLTEIVCVPSVVSTGIVTVFEIEPSSFAVVVPSVTGVECNVSVSVEPAFQPVSVTVIDPPGATDGSLVCTDDVVDVVVLPAVLIVVVVGFTVVVVGASVVVVVGASVVVVVVGSSVVVVGASVVLVGCSTVVVVVGASVVVVVVGPAVVVVVGPPTVVVVVPPPLVVVVVGATVVDVVVGATVVVVVPPLIAFGMVIDKNVWSPVADEAFDATRIRHAL